MSITKLVYIPSALKVLTPLICTTMRNKHGIKTNVSATTMCCVSSIIEVIMFIIISSTSTNKVFVEKLMFNLNLITHQVQICASYSSISLIQRSFYPFTPKILLLILPSSCCTFPCKLITRIWC